MANAFAGSNPSPADQALMPEANDESQPTPAEPIRRMFSAPKMLDLEFEFILMAACQLDQMETDTRFRVLRYLMDRYGGPQ